jgi:translation initiation factor 2 subunit 2
MDEQLKKKKKKKIAFDYEDDWSEDDQASEVTEVAVCDLDLAMGSKKKKKKKPVAELVEQCLAIAGPDQSGASPGTSHTELPTYDELLARAYANIKVVDRHRFNLHPPQMTRFGKSKTAFVNFTDMCRTMHRTANS